MLTQVPLIIKKSEIMPIFDCVSALRQMVVFSFTLYKQKRYEWDVFDRAVVIENSTLLNFVKLVLFLMVLYQSDIKILKTEWVYLYLVENM